MKTVKTDFKDEMKPGIMQELKDVVLPIGQIIWLNGYGQDSHSHDRRAIYETYNSDFDGRLNYRWVNLDDPAKGIEQAYGIRPGSEIFGIGIYYTPGDICKTEEIVEALSKANKREGEQKEAARIASEERTALIAKGREIFEANRPGDAKAVIIAEHMVDDSDSMTDYFASHDDKTVILAFSSHERDLFSEMRKAAVKFEHTQHLGPEKGIFEPLVLIDTDFCSNGSYYHKGQRSPWHRELTDNKEFQTREDCQKYINGLGALEPITADNTPVNFTTGIHEETIEHREKYSMGAGYYLGRSHYAGWIVRKQSLKWHLEDLYYETGRGNFFALKNSKPEPAAPVNIDGLQLVDYSDKALALFGNTKPIKDSLKEMGGRFNPALTLNGERVPGWIFPKSKRAMLESIVN